MSLVRPTNDHVEVVEPATANDGASLPHLRPKLPFRRSMALVALACMWMSAQAPLFLMAGAPKYIYQDIGGAQYWAWFIMGHLLSTAAVAPFVGALSDLLGRRVLALVGSILIIVGQAVCGFAQDMSAFIGGMVVTGVGTGISELTVIAGVSELVPVAKRGYYLALVTLSVIPYMPSVMYAQLIASRSKWRYIALMTAGSALVAFGMTLAFYVPPKPATAHAPTRADKVALVKRMDLVGGFLSISGLAAVVVALLGGGYLRPWSDKEISVPLAVGLFLLIAFFVWEMCGAPYPMLPRRLGRAPRTLLMTMVVTFVSGANFFSVLLVWPSQSYNMWDYDPVAIGIRGMPFAFGTLAGCLISLVLLSVARGKVKWVLFGFSVVMTIGCGCMALARRDNLNQVYAILFIAGLGVGGIVVPASTVTTYICPPDLLATITALTISIRIVGGAVGYAIYYNVFANKLKQEMARTLVPLLLSVGVTDPATIGKVCGLVAASMLEPIRALVGGATAQYEAVVAAGQEAFEAAYPWVYLVSIGFGGMAIVACLLIEDLSGFVEEGVVAHI